MHGKRICALLLLISLTVCCPTPCHAAPIRVHKNSAHKIALTFDDGPHPRYTAEILEILARYNVKATFFQVGQNVTDYPDIARRVREEGHEIGNHTYSHPKLSSLADLALARELEQAADALQAITGGTPHLFRPPEGVISKQILSLAAQMEYQPVLWSVDTRDWAHTPTAQIVRHVLSTVQDGDIILFHDYVVGSSPTPDALRQLLPALLARGFQPVTITELLESE